MNSPLIYVPGQGFTCKNIFACIGKLTLNHLYLKGMVFENIVAFRAALVEHAVRARMRLNRIRNERMRVTVSCAAIGCPWIIHASPITLGELAFRVKTYNPVHTCNRAELNDAVTYKWVADKLVPLL